MTQKEKGLALQVLFDRLSKNYTGTPTFGKIDVGVLSCPTGK